MDEPCYLLLCTCPDADTARTIAAALVERKLAACVNILPGVTSIYRWQDQVEEAGEVLLLIKTTAARYPAVETDIRALHPYDVPEIIAVPLADGLPAYLRWIAQSTEKST